MYNGTKPQKQKTIIYNPFVKLREIEWPIHHEPKQTKKK